MSLERAVVITAEDGKGRVCRDSMVARHGAPAQDMGGGSAWAERRLQGRTEWVFASTPELDACLSRGAVELWPGLTAQLAMRDPAATSLAGPGATFAAMMQSTPGIRQRAFPLFSAKWASALTRAATHGVKP